MVERELSLSFLRVVEEAAIACAHTMGMGDRHHSDRVAVESMRKTMDSVPMRGTIVIGEGERDEAPMLYIGEKVGAGTGAAVDIAVDPLEGTNLCATGAPGAITVLAASERGGLLNAPDCYMDKIVVGPSCKDAVDLDSVRQDLAAVVQKALEPAHISVWMNERGEARRAPRGVALGAGPRATRSARARAPQSLPARGCTAAGRRRRGRCRRGGTPRRRCPGRDRCSSQASTLVIPSSSS